MGRARDHFDATIEALVNYDRVGGGLQVAYKQRGEGYRREMFNFAKDPNLKETSGKRRHFRM